MLRLLHLTAALHLTPHLIPVAAPPGFPAEVDFPVEAHQYLVGGRRRAEGLLVGRLFDMHAQGGDAHSIVRKHSFSTAPHSCSKIEHHSDTYHNLWLKIRVKVEGRATNVM